MPNYQPTAFTSWNIKEKVRETEVGEHSPFRNQTLQVGDVFFRQRRVLPCELGKG
jgi:hypothetical protein